MKIIVYTCNIGHYDLFRNIFPEKKDNIEYIYFTDEDQTPVNGWKVMKVDRSISNDDRRLARYYKINPHKVLPEHNISIWVDARFILKEKNALKFASKYKKNDVSCFNYPWDKSDCAYKEAIICASNYPEDVELIQKQVSRYVSDGFPKHYGLFATGIIIRKNNSKVAAFNNTWWHEVSNYSHRDQISQQYSAWKNGIKIKEIDNEKNVYNNDLVITYKHRVGRREHKKLMRDKNGLQSGI